MQNDCAKQLWKNANSSKDADHLLESLLKISYLYRHFSLFYTFSNQLPDFSVSGTFAANELKPNIFYKNITRKFTIISFKFDLISKNCQETIYLKKFKQAYFSYK